jgi:hypothetical protein
MIIELITGLHEARAEGPKALESYLEETFDVDMVLKYLAVMNYLAPFDDMYHNYWMYRRVSDAKWFLIPWDLDLTMGGNLDADTSVFVGEEGDRSNARGVWNYLKDSFLKTYREDYLRQLKSFNRDILGPRAVKGLIDSARDQVDLEEARSAPGGTSCDFEGAVSQMKNFSERRSAVIADLGAGF